MDRKKFGRRLQLARKEKRLTGEQLAEKTNLSTTYIRQLENGSRIPSLPVFIDIINALDCGADAILADSVSASNDIVISELSGKLNGLSPERLSEITTVVDAMLSYMKN